MTNELDMIREIIRLPVLPTGIFISKPAEKPWSIFETVSWKDEMKMQDKKRLIDEMIRPKL
jgi:hypothetical protein